MAFRFTQNTLKNYVFYRTIRFNKHLCNSCRKYCVIGNKQPKEIKIPFPGGHIAGKHWNEEGSIPTIAVHGIFDNAGSFDRLIPLLSNDLSVFAMDFIGHGLSSHKPINNVNSFFFEHLPSLHRVIKYFNWEKVNLIGHSMGAGVSMYYAGCMSETVEKLIMIDIIKTNHVDYTKTPNTTAEYLNSFMSYDYIRDTPPKRYDYESLVEKLVKDYGGSLDEETVAILLKRGSKKNEDNSYSLVYDPLLKLTSYKVSPLTICFEQQKQFASNIKAEMMIIMGSNGFRYEDQKYYDEIIEVYKKSAPSFSYNVVEGTHHPHLSNPENVSALINKFLVK